MSGPTLRISEKLAIIYGVKTGDKAKAVTEGNDRQAQRDNLHVIFGNLSYPLIGPEGNGIQAGQIVEVIVEEKEIMLSEEILGKYQINDGDTFVIQWDKDAGIDDRPYIITPSGKVLLRNIERFSPNYREGDILHVYLFSPRSVKYKKAK
jgi:hypothetical protein